MRRFNFFLIFFAWIISFSINSQQFLDIDYPGRTFPAPVTASVEIDACETSPTAYSISVDNFSPFALSGLTFKFDLPAGINYAGGFVGPVGSSVLDGFEIFTKDGHITVIR